MSVNKRVFGTQIHRDVANILKARQGENVAVEPGDSLESTKTSVSNYDYASRLPFVRMWTSVKILQSADIEGEEIPASEYEDTEVVPLYKLRKEMANKLDTSVDKTTVKEIKDKDGKTTKYIVKGIERDQMDYARQIYEVGNHNYLKNYGEKSPNESITFQNNENESVSLESPFQVESERNPFMKPQSGITSISSNTEGALGLIKKTTVNFVVHNFYDFDNIFSKYFLAPGAQIFVDFGFADIPNLYDPKELIEYAEGKKDGVQGFLYGETSDDGTETIGFVTKNLGDVEVLQGIVTDYSAKIRQDGGVECSVTLTSKNSALLSFATDEDVVMKTKSILTRGVLYLGLRAIVSSGDENDSDKDLKQLMSTPNADASSDSIETYNQNILILAKQELSGRSGPEGNSIRTGVFVENLNADNTFITWGLFEDLILNSQFGFGKDNKDIVEGKNLQVKVNSSNAFTRWTSENKEKQHVLMAVPEDIPAFLYPEWWGAYDPNEKDAAGSYSYQVDKLPVITEYDGDGNILSFKSYQNEELSFENDKEIGRIPIREVFINVDMIVKAFESNSDVKKVIEEILGELNKEGDGLFDWRMKQGETDGEVEIIDVNYTISELKPDVDDYFIFNVQSPTSMIKDYNLDFKIPAGNLGNMYAIQGMGVGDTIFTTNKSVKDAIATNVLDPDLIKIIYEPDLGNYRGKQLLDEPKVDSETFNVFRSVDNLFDNNVYKVSTTERPNIIKNQTYEPVTIAGVPVAVGVDFQSDLTNEKVVTSKSERQPKLTAEDIIKTSNETLEAAGYKVAKTFKEYYKYTISQNVEETIPNLLPYNLSITILGIASLNVGDTFKVDYLPNRYQKSTYLQITKISHEIGPGGWFTTLDTAFRLLPTQTNIMSAEQTKNKIRLSPSALTNMGFEDKIEADAGFWSYGNDVKMADLAPYMTDITIGYNADWKFDYALHFKMAKELDGELENESGIIKNSRGNFFADFPEFVSRNTALQSIDSGDWYSDDGDGLGHSYYIETTNSRVWPPDFQLIPGHLYTIMVAADKVGILYRGESLENIDEYYEKTFKFFQQYYGMNGKGISEVIGEGIQSTSEAVLDFLEDLIY